MNKLWLPALVMSSLCIAAAQSSNITPYQNKAEQYIRESEAQWAASVATGDTTTIERILADDFIGVDPKGTFYDKATMIADTRKAPQFYSSNRIDDVRIRFFGDTAVAQGSESWVRQTGERGRFVWTDTWVLREGRWQIVAAEDLIAEPLQEG